MNIRHLPLPLVLILICPFATTEPILAQSPSGSDSSTVVIATMEDIPRTIRSRAAPDSRVVSVVIRSKDETDLILLHDGSATPPVLAAALRALRDSREQMPNPDRGYVFIGTIGGAPPAQFSGGAVELVEALRQVRATPLRSLRNLGDAHWFEFTPTVLGF